MLEKAINSTHLTFQCTVTIFVKFYQINSSISNNRLPTLFYTEFIKYISYFTDISWYIFGKIIIMHAQFKLEIIFVTWNLKVIKFKSHSETKKLLKDKPISKQNTNPHISHFYVKSTPAFYSHINSYSQDTHTHAINLKNTFIELNKNFTRLFKKP